jgi:AhpD family alkylhydroperoxidase
MRAFQGMMRAASSEAALSKRVKELMALAIAVHARCEGCVVFHVSMAIAHGASRDEVSEALAVAVEMGGGPAAVYAGSAIVAFDELKGKAE